MFKPFNEYKVGDVVLLVQCNGIEVGCEFPADVYNNIRIITGISDELILTTTEEYRPELSFYSEELYYL